MCKFIDNTPWIQSYSNGYGAPRHRLFCFPYAGGGASAFKNWSCFLPNEFEILAIQLPGRENRIREQPIGDLNELIFHISNHFRNYLDMPFTFYGHSTGALIAYELVRELRRRRLPEPDHLIVSGARAPHISEPNPIHHLPDDEFINALRRFSGTPDALLENRELMKFFLPVLRADFALEEKYCHQEEIPLHCPISAFAGENDHETPLAVLKEWDSHTMSGFHIDVVSGDHFFIVNQQRRFLSLISHRLLSSSPLE